MKRDSVNDSLDSSEINRINHIRAIFYIIVIFTSSVIPFIATNNTTALLIATIVNTIILVIGTLEDIAKVPIKEKISKALNRLVTKQYILNNKSSSSIFTKNRNNIMIYLILVIIRIFPIVIFLLNPDGGEVRVAVNSLIFPLLIVFMFQYIYNTYGKAITTNNKNSKVFFNQEVYMLPIFAFSSLIYFFGIGLIKQPIEYYNQPFYAIAEVWFHVIRFLDTTLISYFIYHIIYCFFRTGLKKYSRDNDFIKVITALFIYICVEGMGIFIPNICVVKTTFIVMSFMFVSIVGFIGYYRYVKEGNKKLNRRSLWVLIFEMIIILVMLFKVAPKTDNDLQQVKYINTIELSFVISVVSYIFRLIAILLWFDYQRKIIKNIY